MAEFGAFLRHIAPRLHPKVRYEPAAVSITDADTGSRANSDGNMYHFAMQVIFNLPPLTRLNSYIDSNYDHIQVLVNATGSKLPRLAYSLLMSRIPWC